MYRNAFSDIPLQMHSQTFLLNFDLDVDSSIFTYRIWNSQIKRENSVNIRYDHISSSLEQSRRRYRRLRKSKARCSDLIDEWMHIRFLVSVSLNLTPFEKKRSNVETDLLRWFSFLLQDTRAYFILKTQCNVLAQEYILIFVYLSSTGLCVFIV